MKRSITRAVTPEQRDLENKKKELRKLEELLAQRELNLATLRAELRAIDLLYIRRVGSLLARLDIVEARIAKVLSGLNPEQKPVEDPEEEDCKPAEEPRPKGKTPSDPGDDAQFKPTKRLRNLYREAAKSIHPDLAANQEDQDTRTAWMVEINAAYQAGDEERLASLLEQWYASPESVQGASPDAELERTIRKIAQANQRLKDIQVEMDRMKQSFAFSLRKRMRDAEKEGRDLLEEMSLNIEKKLSRKQSLLDDLLKNAPPIFSTEW
jgi:hypothetical protein